MAIPTAVAAGKASSELTRGLYGIIGTKKSSKCFDKFRDYPHPLPCRPTVILTPTAISTNYDQNGCFKKNSLSLVLVSSLIWLVSCNPRSDTSRSKATSADGLLVANVNERKCGGTTDCSGTSKANPTSFAQWKDSGSPRRGGMTFPSRGPLREPLSLAPFVLEKTYFARWLF